MKGLYEIVRIGKGDAHYGNRANIIGLIGTWEARDKHRGWETPANMRKGTFIELNPTYGRKLIFLEVQLKQLSV